MRTLLLGTDFTYTSDGSLIPLEINTNVGMENSYLENDDNIFDLSSLTSFITQYSFTKITYIGSLRIFNLKLAELCASLNIEYNFFAVLSGNLTVPYVEDSETHLIIRSAYDTTAIVDDVYCKDKVNFMKLIKNQLYNSEFAYINETGDLISNITNIVNNGENPNFILKSVLPSYDKELYPKLYKVDNMNELNVILSNVTADYFMMPYYYNANKLFNNQITVIRSFNLLYPPELKSIHIGSYKKFTDRKNEGISTFDSITFELDNIDKSKYITSDRAFFSPKLLDTDEVEMSDGTFKSGFDLQVGDIVKTIIIPNPNNVDLDDDLANYHIPYDDFCSGVTYSTNRVYAKKKVDRVSLYTEIHFKDGTDWGDTYTSSYLLLKNNEIQFEYIESLVEGDKVVLVDTSSNTFTSVLKEVESVNFSKIIFSGWEITVEINHVFLTRTGSDSNESFAAIEHNIGCSGKSPCGAKTCTGKRSCTTNSSSICYCA